MYRQKGWEAASRFHSSMQILYSTSLLYRLKRKPRRLMTPGLSLDIFAGSIIMADTVKIGSVSHFRRTTVAGLKRDLPVCSCGSPTAPLSTDIVSYRLRRISEILCIGPPYRNRTCNRQNRNLILYPIELRADMAPFGAFIIFPSFLRWRGQAGRGRRCLFLRNPCREAALPRLRLSCRRRERRYPLYCRCSLR